MHFAKVSEHHCLLSHPYHRASCWIFRNREKLEQALALDWNDQVVNQTVDERAEVYTVEPKVWEAAGMELMGGCLCIGCLEKRIGRTLTAKDFVRGHPFNSLPGTKRLLARREQ